MLKLLAVMMSTIALGGLWYGGGQFPWATGSGLDYFLMPFSGYVALMVSANIAGRILPENEDA